MLITYINQGGKTFTGDDGSISCYRARRTHLGIDVRQEILFQRVASRIIYPDYRLKEYLNIDQTTGRSLLYRFGISGEERMVVVKVNSKNMELIKNMVLLHEYLSIMRFSFDLIFLVDEKISYEETLEQDVYEVVERSLSHPYKGSGVYVLNVNDITMEERFTMLSLAKVVFDTSLGSLDEQISMASRYNEPETSAIKEASYEDFVETITPTRGFEEGLDFYNGIGGFSKDGESYVMDVSYEKVLLPWSNIMSNEKFGRC